MRYLIDQGADRNTLGERGSPLQAAIFFDNIPVAKFLLNCSRTDLDLDTGIHGNALQQALVSNQVSVSWDLIKRGARGYNESSYCKTALEAAIRHSNKGLLQTLIDQDPTHLTSGPYPSRIIQRAIVEDKVHALAYLIQCGAKAGALDEYGWTPWLCAQHCHHTKALRILDDHRISLPPLGVSAPSCWHVRFLPDCVKLSPD